MRKTMTLVAAVSLALAFTACNKQTDNLTPEESTTGTTSARVVVSVAQPRAITQADEGGRAAESEVNTMHLLGKVRKDFTKVNSASDVENEFWEENGTYKSATFKTTPVSGELAMALNKGTITMPIEGEFASKTFGDRTTAIADIAAASTEKQFVMTSKSAQKTVKANLEKDAVKNGNGEDQNVFAFDLERIVAQAFVSHESLGTNPVDTKDGEGTVKVDDLTWSVMNGASKTYIMANNAGPRTMDKASGLYKDAGGDQLKSAIHDKPIPTTDDCPDYLIRIGNLWEQFGDPDKTNDDLGGYKARPVAEKSYATDGKESTRGIYFFENSCSADMTNEHYDGYRRLATVKVYATFVPKDVYYYDSEPLFTPDANSGVWYKERYGYGGDDKIPYYTGRTESKEKPSEEEPADGSWTWVQGKVTYDLSAVKKDNGYQAGTTFYIGSNDGVAYSDVSAAMARGNATVYTYTNGRCGYYTLVNRTADKGVKFADTRRNNIYALSIQSFKSRGFNWDPNDPNDPNLPKPETPEENPVPDKHTNDIDPEE